MDPDDRAGPARIGTGLAITSGTPLDGSGPHPETTMLITLLRTGFRKKEATPKTPRARTSRPTTPRTRTPRPTTPRPTTPRHARVKAVVDLGGPLPGPTEKKPLQQKALHPYEERAIVAAALRPTDYRRDDTPLSALPPELDPFEADFPWIGWVEPKHQSVVASEQRTHTFEEDLARVLRMFEN